MIATNETTTPGGRIGPLTSHLSSILRTQATHFSLFWTQSPRDRPRFAAVTTTGRGDGRAALFQFALPRGERLGFLRRQHSLGIVAFAIALVFFGGIFIGGAAAIHAVRE